MASLSLLFPHESRSTPHSRATACDGVLVAAHGDSVAADCAGALRGRYVDLSVGRVATVPESTVVVFLQPALNENDRAAFDAFLKSASQADFVALVSCHSVHLGDSSYSQAEANALERLRGGKTRVAVIRTSAVLSPHSPATDSLRRWAFAAPLVPERMRGCCVELSEVVAAIESARASPRRRRTYTLLGANKPWKERLREHAEPGIGHAFGTVLAYILAILLIGQIGALLLDLLARWRPNLRACNFDTLRPSGFAELLALCNPHNMRHIKVVGYNNGVVHFGHHYPGKTVISTVHCSRVGRTSPDEIRVDCGATIRQARDFLAAANQELYVIPNYSYVCLGTAFFVPIHGSASDYATVAETITRALLYDPAADRFILADSDEPDFRANIYKQTSDLVVLRLWLRVKPKAQYFVSKQEIENATADQILAALRDADAANVEIRKASAGSNKIELSKYYLAANDPAISVMEVPRDSLGRLWDRLEENWLTSFLMHALTRWFAWHVELFFTPEEFATFWATHQALPLKKIQLRYIRRDGLPNSPFREHDCVSVDMFMLRGARAEFEAYLKRTFAVVRSNPGKHSQ